MSKFKKVAAGVPGFKANFKDLPKFGSLSSFLDFARDPTNDIEKFFSGENSKRRIANYK